MDHPEKAKGVSALVTLALGFALIALFGRYLGGQFTPLQQLYIALGVGFIASLFTFHNSLSWSRLKKIPIRDWLIMLSRVVVGYLIAGTLYRASLNLTKISNVTFIQSIPTGAFIGFLLFKEKMTLSKVLLVGLAYIGVVLISIKDYSSIFSVGQGEIFSLISAILFALSFASRKWQTEFLSDKEIAQILLFLGFVILAGTSFIQGEKLPISGWGIGVISAFLITGLFNAINIFLINYGFKRVDNVLASNILTLEAIFALVMAFIFYHEFPSFKELMGGLLIIGSVLFMNRLEKRST